MHLHNLERSIDPETLIGEKSLFDQLERREREKSRERERLVLHKQGTNLEIETLQMNEGLVDKRDGITKKDETTEEMIGVETQQSKFEKSQQQRLDLYEM